MNKQKYYAKLSGTERNLAVFDSKEYRDKWINFQDKYCKEQGLTKEYASFDREAITYTEAKAWFGDRVDYDIFLEKDEYDPKIRWIYY